MKTENHKITLDTLANKMYLHYEENSDFAFYMCNSFEMIYFGTQVLYNDIELNGRKWFEKRIDLFQNNEIQALQDSYIGKLWTDIPDTNIYHNIDHKLIKERIELQKMVLAFIMSGVADEILLSLKK